MVDVDEPDSGRICPKYRTSDVLMMIVIYVMMVVI